MNAYLKIWPLLLLLALPVRADIVIGGEGTRCSEDPACINRFHSEIPMAARAKPGERITMIGRDAGDMHLDPDEYSVAESSPRDGFGVVHPMVGPVYIEGAAPGDVLAVTIENIKPGPVGWTSASEFGFAGDAVGSESRFILWRLNEEYAESDAIPGVRIPNSSFPGVVATMPAADQLVAILDREQRLADAGGAGRDLQRHAFARQISDKVQRDPCWDHGCSRFGDVDIGNPIAGKGVNDQTTVIIGDDFLGFHINGNNPVVISHDLINHWNAEGDTWVFFDLDDTTKAQNQRLFTFVDDKDRAKYCRDENHDEWQNKD